MSRGLLAVFARDDSIGDHETIQELVAPFFLGLVVNYFLWGVQVTQSYYYYKTYRQSDRLWVKIAVGLLFITDAIESISVSEAGWRFLVEGWGDINAVSLVPGWGLNATPIMDSFTASIVHFFYAQKIWKLLDIPFNYICTVVVVSFSLLQLAAGIGCTAFMFSIHMTLFEFGRIKTWVSIWLVTAAVTDIVITALMTGKLSKSRTGFRKTDDLITKLIQLTVETGLATAIVQIVDIVVYLVWPLKSYHIVPAFIGPKVYSNSMLALLNSRTPRNHPVTMTWTSTSVSQDRPIDNIHIRTTQTVAVANDYELGDKMTTKSTRRPRTANEERTAPDAESLNSLPFKDSEFVVA